MQCKSEAIATKGAVTKPGDIWKLGEHRLMCGDSTSEVDFAKLMNGNRAQMAVTSPPYGVGKDYETKGIEPWFETMRPVVKNLTKYAGIICWNLGDLYATGTQFIEPTNFYSSQLFAENGFRPMQIAAGVPLVTVSGRAGHARTSTTTDIYSHLLKSSDKTAAETLEQLFD